MSQATASMKVGDTKQVTASATPAGADNEATVNATIKYASDNEAIATVAADGTIKAVAAGSANITATSGSFTASTKVTVTATA